MTKLRVSNGEASFIVIDRGGNHDIRDLADAKWGESGRGIKLISAALPDDLAGELARGVFIPPCVKLYPDREHPTMQTVDGIEDANSRDLVAKMGGEESIPDQCIKCIAQTLANIANGHLEPERLEA